MRKIVAILLLIVCLFTLNNNVVFGQTYTTESKNCGSCGKEVSINSSAGMRCPHCGVRWGYENESYNTTPNPYQNNNYNDDEKVEESEDQEENNINSSYENNNYNVEAVNNSNEENSLSSLNESNDSSKKSLLNIVRFMILILFNILIVGLFLYSKLLPYKDKLNTQYKGIFNFFNSVFTPVLNFLKKFVKPFQVGQGLSVDLTQIILLILFLILLNTL